MRYQATPAQEVVEHALRRGFVTPEQVEGALLGGQTHEGLLPQLRPHLSAPQLAELQEVYRSAQAKLEQRQKGRPASTSGAIPIPPDADAFAEDGESTHVLTRPPAPPALVGESTAILSASRASGAHTLPDLAKLESAGESTAILSAHQASGLHPIPSLARSSASDDPTVVANGGLAAVANSDELPEPGDAIGAYEIVHEIARGTMGVVYLGRHRELGREVAIKLALCKGWRSEQLVARFEREGQALARLDHRNIVRVHQVGSRGENPYMVLDLIDGQSLGQRLKTEGALDEREAAQIAEELARALEHAHGRGVLHRDLKPDNILLGTDGRPRLTDFGLTNAQEEQQRLTATGEMLGTPAFMPPEQASGERAEVGPRSDVYSLGATLYVMLTGQRPFKAKSTINLITKVIREAPRAPRAVNPEVDPDLAVICMKCLEKAPRDRYASASALASDLGRFLRGEPIVARPISWVARTRRRLRRDRPLARVSLALALALTALAGLAIHRQAFPGSSTEGQRTILSIAPVPSSVHGQRLKLRFSVTPIVARVRVRVGAGPWTRLRTAKGYAPELDLALGENVVTIEVARGDGAPSLRRTLNVSCLSPRWWVDVRESEARPSLPLPTGLGFGEGRGTYTHAKTGVVFVWIPPGEFVFGLNLKDGVGITNEDETPASPARITRGLFLGRYELTREQLGVFLRATKQPIPELEEGDERLPAVTTWIQANAYCEWAGLRLPTEGEWEYAAEGGSDGTNYPWGGEAPTYERCNWAGIEDKPSGLVPVGSFPAGASRWGCQDMSGSLWEWTQDLYLDRYPRFRKVRIDPKNLKRGEGRVLRGGSYTTKEPRRLRAGFRGRAAPTESRCQANSVSEFAPDCGVRVALSPQ